VGNTSAAKNGWEAACAAELKGKTLWPVLESLCHLVQEWVVLILWAQIKGWMGGTNGCQQL
jgi:hypothetical protein